MSLTNTKPKDTYGTLLVSTDNINITNGLGVPLTSSLNITASHAISASFAPGGGGATLVTASTYPITSSWSSISTFAVLASSSFTSTASLTSTSSSFAAVASTASFASNYALKSGDTMSGALIFTGSGHFGLRVQHLSTTERDALTDGMDTGHIIYNHTVGRYDFRIGEYAWSNFVNLSGDTMTGALTVSSSILANRYEASEEILAFASTCSLNFSTYGWKSVDLAGDIQFSSSFLASRREISVKILADGSTRTLSFPSGWKFVGGATPTSIAANKTAIFSARSWGATDSTVVASYAVQS